MYTCTYMYRIDVLHSHYCVHVCTCIILYTRASITAVSAKGFEYDDLYVTLHLELPDCKHSGFYACIVSLLWNLSFYGMLLSSISIIGVSIQLKSLL